MGCRGFVLPFVLIILLSLGILFQGLLHASGNLRRYADRVAREAGGIYAAESAIVAFLHGLPHGEVAIESEEGTLWGRVCAPVPGDSLQEPSKVCALYGSKFARFRFEDWMLVVQNLRRGLREGIAGDLRLRHLSGNRRFFTLDSSVAFRIQDGDLYLDLDGRVRSASFDVDGNVAVKGGATFDTLRIFARGNVELGGRVSVAYLELVSDAFVEVKSEFSFSGGLYGRDGLRIAGRAHGIFPCVAVSLGSGDSRAELAGHALFEGVIASPGGSVDIEDKKNLLGASYPGPVTDSSFALLPVVFDGDRMVFRRRFEP